MGNSYGCDRFFLGVFVIGDRRILISRDSDRLRNRERFLGRRMFWKRGRSFLLFVLKLFFVLV